MGSNPPEPMMVFGPHAMKRLGNESVAMPMYVSGCGVNRLLRCMPLRPTIVKGYRKDVSYPVEVICAYDRRKKGYEVLTRCANDHIEIMMRTIDELYPFLRNALDVSWYEVGLVCRGTDHSETAISHHTYIIFLQGFKVARTWRETPASNTKIGHH